MKENGYCIIDMDYVRPIKIYPEFLDELRTFDVFNAKDYNNAEILMIHGTKDETAPFSETKRFSDKYGVKLISIPNGHHRLMEDDQVKKVITEAINFFK